MTAGQVCGRVQLEAGCDLDALLTALCGCLALDEPLPHRTTAAAALAALAMPREHAVSIARWLTGTKYTAACAANVNGHSVGCCTRQPNGRGDQPAASARDQGAEVGAGISMADRARVVAAQRGPTLLGFLAALINCTAQEAR